MSEKDIEYIRTAAYFMWENAGKPEGKSEEFWSLACEQFLTCGYDKKAKAPAKKAVAKKTASKATKSMDSLDAKPVVKVASAIKAPAKKAAKSKISPVPVKSPAKIITPLYGSVKK
ncbi:MAG: DUF2934 domain-containing protein [Alphaproteobacteria bacterium]|nr:DUF2934 domain-containing protein [Alphaproteobacteria bacterium]